MAAHLDLGEWLLYHGSCGQARQDLYFVRLPAATNGGSGGRWGDNTKGTLGGCCERRWTETCGAGCRSEERRRTAARRPTGDGAAARVATAEEVAPFVSVRAEYELRCESRGDVEENDSSSLLRGGIATVILSNSRF